MVVGGAVQVVTDVLEVLGPHDRPDGTPPVAHVGGAVLGVRVLGADLGDQDEDLSHDIFLRSKELTHGMPPLLALLAGPVLARSEGEHGRQNVEHLTEILQIRLKK